MSGFRTASTIDIQPSIETITMVTDGDSSNFTNTGYTGATVFINVTAITGTSVVFTLQGRDPNDSTLTYAVGTGGVSGSITAAGLHVIHCHPGLTAASESSGISVAKNPMPAVWSLDVNVTSLTVLTAVVSVVYFN